MVAIEPGIEGLEGIGGVRFEDLLLITDDGLRDADALRVRPVKSYGAVTAHVPAAYVLRSTALCL